MNEKPKAAIIGADSNIFNVLGIASNALKESGQKEKANEMFDRVTSSDSYDEALLIITDYVEPVSIHELSDEMDFDY